MFLLRRDTNRLVTEAGNDEASPAVEWPGQLTAGTMISRTTRPVTSVNLMSQPTVATPVERDYNSRA